MKVLTVGVFLLEKATNMQKWLQEELLNPPNAQWIGSTLTEVAVTTLATKLSNNNALVYNRDWSGLCRMAQSSSMDDLVTVLEAVRLRPDMHDKFWRYLDLFVDVVKNN